jgi:hypothetical protein
VFGASHSNVLAAAFMALAWQGAGWSLSLSFLA